MSFQKAERRRAKLKIALTGPSGAGKTFSALKIAAGIGKKVALIDTENESASLYGDKFNFDTLCIKPPYTVKKYADAILMAEKAGYDVLVIDSITHAWAGEGGLLEKKEALDSKGGNSYTNWGAITKEQEQFKAKLLNCEVHLICTMRSKQDYVLTTNEKGKAAPQKVGMAPIQRDGMEYEFTTVFDLSIKHQASVSKDRTGLFDGQIFVPDEKTGEAFIEWLGSAKAAEPQKQQPKDDAQGAGSADEARGTQRDGAMSPGDYIIPITGILKGKKLSEVDPKMLTQFEIFCSKNKNYESTSEAIREYCAIGDFNKFDG